MKVCLDGRSHAFLGFHFATSLDYYSMGWGQPSPDGTKIVSSTSMFDNTDMMLMIAHRPLPPVNLRAVAQELKWEPPRFHSEVKGYLVHAATRSGGPYRQLTGEPVASVTWRLPAAAPQPGYYVVTAVEHAGLESPYSDEAEVGVKGHEPLRLFTEAELLAMESPVVERRDVLAANWHYVAQDPYVRTKRKRDGKLVWRCSVPGRFDGQPLTLWARARSELGPKQGLAKALSAGPPEGTLVAAGRTWQWVRANGQAGKPLPVRVTAGLADVTIVPVTSAFAVDMLALTSDPNDRPRGPGNADQQPPRTPAGLSAASVGPHEVFLQWTANPEFDVSHYNVYASPDSRAAPVQAMLVGSPREPRFVDWGLKSGTRYSYIVTAVDRAGNRSASSKPVFAATAPKATDLILLEAEAAERQEIGEGESVAFLGEAEICSGGKFVGARLPGGDQGRPGTLTAEARKRMKERLEMPAKHTSLSWRVNVRVPGEYMVWLRLRSRDREVRPAFCVDGKELARPRLKVGWYDARVAQSMWGDVAKAYRWFWTDVPMYMELDPRPLRVKLATGRHVLKIDGIRAGLDVDAVVLTSDYSWIPEGSVNYY